MTLISGNWENLIFIICRSTLAKPNNFIENFEICIVDKIFISPPLRPKSKIQMLILAQPQLTCKIQVWAWHSSASACFTFFTFSPFSLSSLFSFFSLFSLFHFFHFLPPLHPRSLWGRWWFLRGVLVVFDILNMHNIHQGRYVSIFRSTFLGSGLTAGFSRASSKEFNRTLEVPERRKLCINFHFSTFPSLGEWGTNKMWLTHWLTDIQLYINI
jgi:hypothetical protein